MTSVFETTSLAGSTSAAHTDTLMVLSHSSESSLGVGFVQRTLSRDLSMRSTTFTLLSASSSCWLQWLDDGCEWSVSQRMVQRDTHLAMI